MSARAAGSIQAARSKLSAVSVAALPRLPWLGVQAVALGIGAMTLSVGLATPARAAAVADTAQPQVDNAPNQFQGRMTRAEYVRSGPGINFYPTQRLESGATVVVVGAKGDWLKIVPPEGSFSYVPKTWVQAFGDGKVGRVKSDQVIVRAGSSVLPNMWVTQTKLESKDTVQILGEEDQYFKIKPPTGAYLFVAKDAVKAEARLETPAAPPTVAPAASPTPAGAPAAAAAASAAPAAGTTASPAGGATPPPVPTPAVSEAPVASPAAPSAAAGPAVSVTPDVPTPPPAGAEVASGGATASPSTQPSPEGSAQEHAAAEEPPLKPLAPAEANERLQSLEQQFLAASQQPLADQPIRELQRSYEHVGSTQGLSPVAKRIVDVRLATLKVRAEARDQLANAEKSQQQNQDRLTAQQAERQEIQDQMQRSQMPIYAAVGTLRPSSLQISKTPLFRLTDPASGRTLAYVWGTEGSVAQREGAFVGVRGAMQTDGRLNFKVITPTAVDTLDPATIHTAYAADVAPPSMRPTTPTATIEPQQ